MNIMSQLLAVLTALIMLIQSLFGIGSPEPVKPQEPQTVKNVIFMIGDGMGFNSIAKTKYEDDVGVFFMDTFPISGSSKTRSASDEVTDSAAGATALACGVRTNNGGVGVYPTDMEREVSYPMNLAELALSHGKLAGVVTTDKTSGATPACFSSHTSSRNNENDITTQQMASKLTLIWGASSASFSDKTAANNGFKVIKSRDDMYALKEGSRSFGQFEHKLWHNYAYKNVPTLTEMTEKAIDLLDDDPDGFFLMVEGAHIDKNSHNNDGEAMKDALKSFDNAVGAALMYAQIHKDTMVIVTADHETGGIVFENGEYKYTTGSHTGVNVPLFVYGYDGFIKDGEAIDNYEIPIKAAKAMGYKDFPDEMAMPVKAAA